MVTPLIPFRAVIHLRQVHMGLSNAILLFPLAKRLVFVNDDVVDKNWKQCDVSIWIKFLVPVPTNP